MHGFFSLKTRLGGTSLKAAALLSALRAQVPEAALSNGRLPKLDRFVDVSYKEWCGICMILMGLYGFIWVYDVCAVCGCLILLNVFVFPDCTLHS